MFEAPPCPSSSTNVGVFGLARWWRIVMSCADGRHRSPRAIEDGERSPARSMGFLYNGGTSRSLSFTSRTGACIRCLFNEHRGFSHEGRATWREQAVCGYRRRRMFRVHPQAGHFSLYEGGGVKLRLGSCIVVSVG